MGLFKYINPNILDFIFSEDGFSRIKCSLPRDYNDPYELFLTLDARLVDPHVLAFYLDVVGDIPQYPTTCFSKTPKSIPMWAHYGCNSKGFVINFSEDRISEQFPEASIEDVDYLSGSNFLDSNWVLRACMTAKPRHTLFLRREAFTRAYFSKSNHWSYEQERRLIIGGNDIVTQGEHMLLGISDSAVGAIIAGCRASSECKEKAKRICQRLGCDFYEMKLGRSSIDPYFLSSDGNTLVYDGEDFVSPKYSCRSCGEPTDVNFDNSCPWCSLTGEDRYSAALRNPFRMLARCGLLDDYLKNASDIESGHI